MHAGCLPLLCKNFHCLRCSYILLRFSLCYGLNPLEGALPWRPLRLCVLKLLEELVPQGQRYGTMSESMCCTSKTLKHFNKSEKGGQRRGKGAQSPEGQTRYTPSEGTWVLSFFEHCLQFPQLSRREFVWIPRNPE